MRPEILRLVANNEQEDSKAWNWFNRESLSGKVGLAAFMREQTRNHDPRIRLMAHLASLKFGEMLETVARECSEEQSKE